MPKLNQIIAIEKDVKQTSNRKFTDIYHELQKAQLVTGVSRTYQPKDDEGDQLPAESTEVQLTVSKEMEKSAEALKRLFDVTLTKEVANQEATADVVVDGEVLLADVPVTYLLFLERQLTDFKTVFSSIPVLDPAIKWTLDLDNGVYKSDPVETLKSKKVPFNWVRAAATDKHPAQVDVLHEDVNVGTWTTVRLSGALPQTEKDALLERVATLQEAVKFAREKANEHEVINQEAGDKVFGYLFG